ncbi:MAG: acetyl-CoA C-acetyltransferase [Candidatus Obscuribacterales bacterium]|nr:acetyl-CoA C-acetyltransferase [Candidatus Obscuribacterales bacterium]
METVYILDAVRTPRARAKTGSGAFSKIHPQELLGQTLNELTKRNPTLEPGDVEDVIVGVATQSGEQGGNLARNAVLAAGWPDRVSGVTLNRFCGSGLQAVNFGAATILAGSQDLVVGGGVESMSQVPIGADGSGLDGNNERLRERVFQVPQGISADLIATREGFTRADVDAFALDSQMKAAKAQSQERFAKSLFAVKDPADGNVVLSKDDHPRPETTMTALGALSPAFIKVGAIPVGEGGATFDQIALRRYPDAKEIIHVHTAGNSSGIADGAAVVLLSSENYARDHAIKPRGKIVAMSVYSTEPVIMLTAPTDAVKKALAKAKMTVADIDLWEINEAFAVVPLQTMRNLKIDVDKVNVNGGAIALAHPLGATGAILLGTALDELERRNLQTALITLCIGGGQAVATIIQRV